MTKAEAIAYLRKKQLLEREAVFVPTLKEEAEEELRNLEEKAPEDLTDKETCV